MTAVTPPNVATEVVVPVEQKDDDENYTPEAIYQMPKKGN